MLKFTISSPRRLARIAPLLAMSLLVGMPARGEGSAASPSTRPAVSLPGAADFLARLDSPDYQTRMAAEEQLCTDESVTVDNLLDLYSHSRSLEQRHRILAAVRHVFIRSIASNAPSLATDHGVLGVSLRSGQTVSIDSDTVLSGIRIFRTMPGFPANARLRPTDLIVKVNNEAIVGADDPRETVTKFQMIFKNSRPGQQVELTVYRDGQMIKVPLTLASANAMNLIYHEIGLRSEYVVQLDAVRQRFMAVDAANHWSTPSTVITPDS